MLQLQNQTGIWYLYFSKVDFLFGGKVKKLLTDYNKIIEIFNSKNGVKKLDTVIDGYINKIKNLQKEEENERIELRKNENEILELKDFAYKGTIAEKKQAGIKLTELKKSIIPLHKKIIEIQEAKTNYTTTINYIEDTINKIVGLEGVGNDFKPNDYKYNTMLNQIPLNDIAEKARELGILDGKAYRNLEIQEYFKKLRKNQIKVDEAEILLAEKYNLSKERIHGIIYGKKV